MNKRDLPTLSNNGHEAMPYTEEPDYRSYGPPPRAGLSLNDILFMLFRHKWKILFLGLMGLGAAAAVYFFFPPLYESDAKLFVRYVLDKNAVDLGDNPQIKVPNPVNDTVIGSEMEILNSEDLARAVAEEIGVEKILPKAGKQPHGPQSIEDATQLINKSLTISAVKGTSIIGLSFTSTDPKLPQPVLTELVKRYFDKHLEVHRSSNAFGVVQKETDLLREQLRQTDDELKELKDKAGVVSLAESRTSLALALGKTQEELDTAEADNASQNARVNLEKATSADKDHPNDQVQIPSADSIHKYQALIAKLGHLQQLENELLGHYTAQSAMVKTKSDQIAAVQKDIQALEKKYPVLIGTATPAVAGGPAKPDILAESAQLAGVQSKVGSLRARYKELQARAKTLNELGPRIEQLEREKGVIETNYQHSQASLEKARIDETLDPSRIPNISVVEAPTPAEKSKRDFLKKFILVLGGGGFALGLAIALTIEMVFDRSVKRPLELERQLQIPVLLAIPNLGRIPKRLALPDGDELLPGETREGALLRPFCEAIRNRLSIFFELTNMRHKPKLVAVMSLAAEAGASTLAEGLSNAIAATEGKVLFFNKVLPPKKFYDALTEFKESDLDYVVFDMPPIEAMSSSMPLAGFMDAVLLVVEAEKTNKALVKRAYEELASKTKTLVIFNKSKTYGPRWLEAEV